MTSGWDSLAQPMLRDSINVISAHSVQCITIIRTLFFFVAAEPANKICRRSRQPQGSEVTTDENFEKNIVDYKRPHRRSKPFSLTAATELKARRASVTVSKGLRVTVVLKKMCVFVCVCVCVCVYVWCTCGG